MKKTVPGSRYQTNVHTTVPDFRGNIATLLRYVQNFPSKICHFQTFATEKCGRIFHDPGWDGANIATHETARPARPNTALPRLSRPRRIRCDFRDQGGGGAIKKIFLADFATDVETARLWQPTWKRRDSKWNGATQNSMAQPTWSSQPKIAIFRFSQTARLWQPTWKRRDSKWNGATQNSMAQPTWSSQPKSFQPISRASFATKRKMARTLWPRRKRRGFPYQGRNGVTFNTKAETAQLSDQSGNGATKKQFFATFTADVDTARLKNRRDSKWNGATSLADATKICHF